MATLDEMLVITFGRAASQELRERVREQLVAAERALSDPSTVGPDDVLLTHLVSDATITAAAQADQRRAGRLRRGDDRDHPPVLPAGAALPRRGRRHRLARRARGQPRRAGGRGDRRPLPARSSARTQTPRRSSAPSRCSWPGQRSVTRRQSSHRRTPSRGAPPSAKVDFAQAVRDEVERRKHRRGVLSYDDLLSRLADALEDEHAPARERMRQRWKIVLVDEFQDTDPVQWDVLDRAFSGHATLVLIGDPKQAIYAFRGRRRRRLPEGGRHGCDPPDTGDQLAQRRAAGRRAAEAEPRRRAGRPAHHGPRRPGAPPGQPAGRGSGSRATAGAAAPVEDFATGRDGTVRIDALREHIAVDLAD